MMHDFTEAHRDAALKIVEDFPHKAWAKDLADKIHHLPAWNLFAPDGIEELLKQHTALHGLTIDEVEPFLAAALTGTTAKVSAVNTIHKLGVSLTHMRLLNPDNTAKVRHINQSNDPKVAAATGTAKGRFFG